MNFNGENLDYQYSPRQRRKQLSFFQSKSLKLEFLENMKSPKGFRRYLGSPLRYAGGKSLATAKIIEFFPNKLRKMVSPFFGGGSVEIATALELDVEVLGYELFDILVKYWQIQLNQPKNLYEKLKRFKPTPKDYDRVKARLKKHWLKEKKLSKLDLASHYFFNHNLSYGPSFLGWMSKIYECPKKYKRAIEKVRDFRCKNLKVFQGSFEKTIPVHNKEFLYLDPPYFLGGKSKMFKGIYPQRNFPIHHKGFNHTLLRDLLLKHKGKFVLSYNDCPEIRKLYKEFDIEKIKWQYTMGQGETRIGFNRIKDNRDHVKKSHELLIIKS